MDDEQLLQEREYRFPYHYVSSFSPDFTQDFCDSWGIHYVSTIEFLLERIDRLSGTSIVDIGCGDGRFSRELALRFPGRQVLGVDYSPRAIGLARAMNADLPGLRFDACDITTLQTPDPADVAVLMEVFEHVPPAAGDDFLAGAVRLLRPGGTLLLTVPHANKPVEPKHFRHFTADSITRALAGHLDVIEVVPFERRSMAMRWLSRLLCNRVFVLRHRRALNWLYRYYKEHLFRCGSEAECQRLFVLARAR